MGVGFQAFNDGNVLQIDGQFKNMSLRHKFRIASNQTVTFDAQTPVVVLCPDPGSGVGISKCTVSGFSNTFEFFGYGAADIYVFDLPITVPYNFGLQVFDGDGNLVFSTTAGYMNVHSTEAVWGTPFTAGDGGGASGFAIPGGKRMGITLSRAGYNVESDYSDVFGAYKFIVYQHIVCNNNGMLGVQFVLLWETEYSYGSGTWPTELGVVSGLNIDVSKIY